MNYFQNIIESLCQMEQTILRLTQENLLLRQEKLELQKQQQDEHSEILDSISKTAHKLELDLQAAIEQPVAAQITVINVKQEHILLAEVHIPIAEEYIFVPEPSIQRFDKCDILKKSHDEISYSKDEYNEIQIIALAKQLMFPIVVKNGKNGKWYLKGKGRKLEKLTAKIQENRGKSRNGVYCLLIDLA